MRRHTRKPRPDGDTLRGEGLALPLCILPEPQPRAPSPSLPGPAAGKPWFGESQRPPGAPEPPQPKTDDQAELLEAERIWWVRRNNLPLLTDGPRDVRRGDKWLPFHFADRGDGK